MASIPNLANTTAPLRDQEPADQWASSTLSALTSGSATHESTAPSYLGASQTHTTASDADATTPTPTPVNKADPTTSSSGVASSFAPPPTFSPSSGSSAVPSSISASTSVTSAGSVSTHPGVPSSTATTPGFAMPGFYPGTPAVLNPHTVGSGVGSMVESAKETAKEYVPIAQEGVRSALAAVGGYFPESVRGYIPGASPHKSTPAPAIASDTNPSTTTGLAPQFSSSSPQDNSLALLPEERTKSQLPSHDADTSKPGLAPQFASLSPQDNSLAVLPEERAKSQLPSHDANIDSSKPGLGLAPQFASTASHDNALAVLPEEHNKSQLPSHDFESATPLGKSGGVGVLPGEKGEGGVAVLPDEKEPTSFNSTHTHQDHAAPSTRTTLSGAGASAGASIRSLKGSTHAPASVTSTYTYDDAGANNNNSKSTEDEHATKVAGILGAMKMSEHNPANTSPANDDEDNYKLVTNKPVDGERSDHGGQMLNTTPRTYPLGKQGTEFQGKDISSINTSGGYPAKTTSTTSPSNSTTSPPTASTLRSDLATAGHGSLHQFDSDRATDGHEFPGTSGTGGRKERHLAHVDSARGVAGEDEKAPDVPEKDIIVPGAVDATAHEHLPPHRSSSIGGDDDSAPAKGTLGKTGTGSKHVKVPSDVEDKHAHSSGAGSDNSLRRKKTPSPSPSHERTGSGHHKPSMMDRIKGEVKVISGKIGGNEGKVEEGKRLLGKN